MTELRVIFYPNNEIVWISEKLASLKSVKIFQLAIEYSYLIPSGRFYRALPVIFPNLEEVRIVASNQTVLNDFRMCFTPSNFAHLKKCNFYSSTSEMHDERSFIGRHTDYEAYKFRKEITGLIDLE